MTKPTTFRNGALAVLAVLALAACNRDWDGGRAAPVGAGSSDTATAPAQDAMGMTPAAAVQGPLVGAAGARAAFAALPDRGDLVGYPQERVVRRDGAYTWHRAEVSEEHALRAILDGELRITAPDGQLLAFEYERHVEHPTGDWTWIGRLRDAPPGRQAILTFGANAVFGNIAQSAAAAPLRLAMRDGASWLVETDPALLAGVESRVLRPEAPDFLLPPIHTGNLSGPKASGDTVISSGASVESSSSTSSSTTTVDVLVGYTSGFAAAQGGDSQARTRINFLIDVANQGFVNSQLQIVARVRLVHAMQVSYPDATENGDALEKLTGYKSGTGQTTPDPAFGALRQARETYGADLVTLVRKFSDPENDGCGIAWLIGGGLKTITQGYEYFGYSVVSDGQDQGSDGKTYYCRDETMVHEFGHNMGSAHDRVTAEGDDGNLDSPDDYGRYTYSFGYKTGPGSGDFYTIMAYPDKRDSAPYQVPYRVFSNPDITFCGGHACGTSNASIAANNALSLRDTMPIISGFRAKVVPDDDTEPEPERVHADFNGDGLSDLLWRHAGTGANAIWLSADGNQSMAVTQITDLAWWMVGVGDFDGDGKADILWRNQRSGANAIWYSGAYAQRSAITTVGDIGWEVVGVGDFDADGRSDILWRHAGTGANAIWPSAQYSQRYNLTRISSLAWKVVGIGDVDGDSHSDIIWRNHATGANAVWFRGQYSLRQNLVGVSDLNWQVVAVADFDGDDKGDLLWRHQGTGANAMWPGASHAGGKLLVTVADVKWRIEEAGDYDGDGFADIIWRHAGSGANAIWPAADYGRRRNLYRVADLKWQIQPK